MTGIHAYGAYVPRLRLNRQAVYDANKWFAPGLRGLAKGAPLLVDCPVGQFPDPWSLVTLPPIRPRAA